jgi:hypothetical protein
MFQALICSMLVFFLTEFRVLLIVHQRIELT